MRPPGPPQDLAYMVPVAAAFHIAETLCATERTGAALPAVVIVSGSTELRSLVAVLSARGHDARAEYTIDGLFEEEDDDEL